MTAPIRVAHVIGSTGVYGAERWIFALMRSPMEGVESILVNLVDEGGGGSSPVVRAALDRGLPAIDLCTGGRFNPVGVFRLARWLVREKYDIVHSHGYKSDLLGLAAARLSGRRVVSTPHGWSRDRPGLVALYERADRLALRFADLACPLSDELCDDLRRSGVRPDRLEVIWNGVDVDEVDAVTPADDNKSGDVWIGYLGQLIRRKDLPCLVDGFARLAASRHDVILVIVGEGPESSALREHVARLGLGARVLWKGYRADGLAILKTFDVLALASYQEGIPRCLMEAMAAGIPVIASDIAAHRRLIVDGVTGRTFRARDAGALADALAAVLDRPGETKEMSRRARELVVGQFSSARMSVEYGRLYHRVGIGS